MLSWPLLNYIINRLVVPILINEVADLIISASVQIINEVVGIISKLESESMQDHIKIIFTTKYII